MINEIQITNTFGGNSTVITYKQDEAGRWTEHSPWTDPEGRPCYEASVIDAVRRYDRKNLSKYFPMAGFHS